MNLSSLLIDHPFADDRDLLHTVDESMNKGQARARMLELTEALAIEPGEGVAVMLPNGPELVCTMAAIWLSGGVYVPVNPRLPDAEVHDVLAQTRPRLFVTTEGNTAVGGEPQVFADDVAFVVWTSGTTGRPKPIMHTHTAYLELLDRVLGPLRSGGTSDREPTPNLIPVSMALNAGIYNALFGLRAGAALVMMENSSRKHSPNSFAASPFDRRSSLPRRWQCSPTHRLPISAP